MTLIRRATFDLHGLPPTPAEVEAFVDDTSPDAYEKLIDRLLASPRYGERWGRHWLDLVRYAESDGFKQDAYRPNAWPYRDYVIQSFNDDKPYDRFVTEQLAGDEIAPGDPDALVATGYLRHGVYEYNQRDVPKQWSQMLNDVTDVTGDAFLGLSMGCARCHDHKFDPILQADYYRLQAFFAPDAAARRSARWRRPSEQPAVRRSQLGNGRKDRRHPRSRWRRSRKRRPRRRWAAQSRSSSRRCRRSCASPQRSARRSKSSWPSWPAGRSSTRARTPSRRSPVADKDKYEALKKQLSSFDADRPKPLPRAMAMTDVGPVAPPTTIPDDPDHPLEPGYLVVLERPAADDPADHALGHIHRPADGAGQMDHRSRPTR